MVLKLLMPWEKKIEVTRMKCAEALNLCAAERMQKKPPPRPDNRKSP